MAARVEIEEELEGDHVETTDYFFEKVGEPVPVGDQDDSPFDLQSPPLQPLAVSERFQLLFVAHSSGFYAARTKDVMDLAKEMEEKGAGSSSSSIKELSFVDVPIGKPHILAISVDNSTLAVSVAADFHLFLVQSLLKKELKPSFSCCLTGTSFVKDIRWRKNSESSFLLLSDNGKLYHGTVNHPPKHIMDHVDAIEWSVKGSFVAVAKGQNLSIFSSKFIQRMWFALPFKSWISDADGDSIVKVDSIRWVRPDCIILGCYLLNVDGKEENYFLQVLRSKGGKITDAASEKVLLSFGDLFPGLIDDILPFENGPYLFLSYLEQGELAITANRKNTDQHILLLSWALGEGKGEPAVVDIERDNWLPRIELQDNGDDNLIMGLCIEKFSIYGKVKVQLGVEEQKELSPYCVLMCLTLEGKLVMFHVASTMGNKLPPDISALSDGEDDFHSVAIEESHPSQPASALEGNKPEQVDFSFSLQNRNRKELPTCENTEFPEKNDSDHHGIEKAAFTGGKTKDSLIVNDKLVSSVESQNAGVPGQQRIPATKLYQDIDNQKRFTNSILPISKTALPNVPDSVMEDFNKKETQVPAGLGATSSSLVDKSRTEVASAELNHSNLQKNVELNKESAGERGSPNLQSVSMPNSASNLWSSTGFSYMSDVKTSFSSSSMSGKPSLSENVMGTSTVISVLGKPADILGQRPSVEVEKIEPLPSIRTSEFSSNLPMEKSAHERFYPPKNDWRSQTQSGSLKSEPHLSKQFSNIKEMARELDALLESIEEKGGFKDACTIFQKCSVESLEKGIASLAETCGVWKNMVDERGQDVKHLLDKVVQVFARNIYMEGIVRQASDSEYWNLWNRQKLSPELELKRKHILKLNQELTKQLIELERHFNSLELNKFGDGVGVNEGRRAPQSRCGPSRHIQSIHSLHNTMTSQIAAAEQLSECLSKQMEVLSIESPLKKPSVKEELFRTIGITCDSTSSSPDMKKVCGVASGNWRTLSPYTAATKDQSGRLNSSALKSHDSDTARRRRDSLDRSWASFEPPKTTVKRMLLQESLKASINKSSLRVDRQPLIDTLEQPSIAWVKGHKSHSVSNKSPDKGDVPGKDFVNQSIAFRRASNPPESSPSTVWKSPTMKTSDRAALSSTSGSHSMAGQNHFSETSYSKVAGPNVGTSHLQKFNAVSVNENQIQSNLQFRPSLFQDQSHSQISSSPKKSPDILKSTSQATVTSNSTPGGVKQTPTAAKSMLFESRFSPAAAVSTSVSSAIEVPKSDLAIGKSQPGEREISSSSSSVPASAPSSLISSLSSTPTSMSLGAKPLFTKSNPSVSAPSSLMMGSPLSSVSCSAVQTSSSALQLSKPTNISTATVNTNKVIPSASSASAIFVGSSSSSFPLPDSKTQVLSSNTLPSANLTIQTSKKEVQPPVDMLTLKKDMDSTTKVLPLQSKPQQTEAGLKIESVASSSAAIEITAKTPSISQPSINQTTSPESTVSLNTRPVQSPGAGVLFPAPLSTAVSVPDSRIESRDVSGTQEDEMEEEAPETNQGIDLSFGNLGSFGIGSTLNSASPKSPFGAPFGNAATGPASSSFSLSVPSGELFKPASFSFQSPQSTQQSQPTSFGAFSGGFGTATSQAPAQSGFGQPANIGAGQQALGTVLGTFGQSRQLGSGLPGSGFSSASSFGGGFPGTQSAVGFPGAAAGGGFASVGATSGGFAALATGGGGFAGAASVGGVFSGLASAGGGFGGSASPTGGFAATPPSGFGGFAGVPSGGVFGAFGGQQGTGGFSGFGGSAGGASKPPEFLTQIRK